MDNHDALDAKIDTVTEELLSNMHTAELKPERKEKQ